LTFWVNANAPAAVDKTAWRREKSVLSSSDVVVDDDEALLHLMEDFLVRLMDWT
jgi:hypothetical protein|tara:strand:- start:100 stop:261 length:162 start_codon:yes stop_codon:yes gene_type:complete